MQYFNGTDYDTLYPETNVRSGLPCELTVHAIANSTIVCSHESSGTGYSGTTNASGDIVFDLNEYGQWTISGNNSWGESDSVVFNVTTVGQFEVWLDLSPFRNMSWASIRQQLEAGNTNIFRVGSVKTITMNGNVVSDLNFNNTLIYCTIIGINHNASIEGNNKIHIQLSTTKDNTGLLGSCQMNTTNTNVGGWNGSYGRNTICNGIYNCLPSDLQAVVTHITKYTDNTGNANYNNSDAVTPTQERVFFLNETEYFGTQSYSNIYEGNYTKQYEWYSMENTNNRRVKMWNNNTDYYWNRSARYSDSDSFCMVGGNGVANLYNASGSLGVAPCLCVGPS